MELELPLVRFVCRWLDGRCQTYLFSFLLQASLFWVFLSGATLEVKKETCQSDFIWELENMTRLLTALCWHGNAKTTRLRPETFPSHQIEGRNQYKHETYTGFSLRTFAAFSRISLSCSSFLCFSIRSNCSKKRSWERTSVVCSWCSSSWRREMRGRRTSC